MHELAFAIAAAGRSVELRGDVDLTEFEQLEKATGVAPELPDDQRTPGAHDVVIVPEGIHDPGTFAHVALSDARAILLLLAPSGLFGWPFTRTWKPPRPTEVTIDALACRDHFQAMAGVGFELWTPMPRLAEMVRGYGLACDFIGSGRPMPYPEPLPKRYDVVTLSQSRWRDLARTVTSQLERQVVHHEIPPCSNNEVLTELGRAKLLIHPMRIEGHSRVAQEARAMGAVPVVLDTNIFGVGLGSEDGSVAVAGIAEMPEVVKNLLANPTRLGELRERGMKGARVQVGWEAYVNRIDAVLSRKPPEDPGRGARAAMGSRLAQHERELRLSLSVSRDEVERDQAEIAKLSALLRVTDADRGRLAGENDHLTAALATERERLAQVQATRVWRVASRYRRLRGRLKRAAAHRPTNHKL